MRKSLFGTDRSTKYVLYAIGEILLVMIGILLALQVNNWNETQQEKRLSIVYLNNLKSDFEDHLEAIEETFENLEITKSSAKYVADFVEGSLMALDTFKLISSLNRAAYLINFKIQNSTWDEIISAGDLKLLTSKELKSEISVFENEYEMMFELEERKYSPVSIEYLNYTSRYFDVSNGFESAAANTSFSKEGIWVDFEALQNNREISIFLRKVFRAADEQQDFLISFLKTKCERIIEIIDAELKKSS
jgi:hypothetical protein